MVKSKGLFLDRDGVINRERGEYTYTIADFKILPGVIPGLKKAISKGYKIIVITNQGGIAKGIYTHEDVQKVHDFMKNQLAENGVQLTDIFYSPHHQDYGKSLDRKPGSLLFEKAMAMHTIAPEKSVMIGDSDRDIEAALKVGIRAIKIEPNTTIEPLIESL